jgi:hypothetical protein
MPTMYVPYIFISTPTCILPIDDKCADRGLSTRACGFDVVRTWPGPDVSGLHDAYAHGSSDKWTDWYRIRSQDTRVGGGGTCTVSGPIMISMNLP